MLSPPNARPCGGCSSSLSPPYYRRFTQPVQDFVTLALGSAMQWNARWVDLMVQSMVVELFVREHEFFVAAPGQAKHISHWEGALAAALLLWRAASFCCSGWAASAAAPLAAAVRAGRGAHHPHLLPPLLVVAFCDFLDLQACPRCAAQSWESRSTTRSGT